MKLLLIIDDYLPLSTKVAAKMMHELALEFQKKGHDVTVLTPNPFQKKPLEVQNLDGIKILFFKSGEIKNINKFKRAINETFLSRLAYKSCKEHLIENPCDGIIYFSPSIFFGPLVKKVKNLWNCKTYLILRDIFPQWAVDNDLLKYNSIIHNYFKFFEKLNYRVADTIGVMSGANLNFFKSKKYNISKFEILYNWSEIKDSPKTGNYFREKLNLKGKIVFFYGGNIGHAQQMSNLIILAKRFKLNKSVHFVFVGKGDEVPLLLDEIKTNNLDNVTYLKAVDQSTYTKMLNEFDIGMFSLHSNHKTHNFPGKLLSYMAFEKPIIGCVNKGNDLADIVNSAKVGIIVNSLDKISLYNAAKKLIDSKVLRNKYGENGKKLLVDKFSVTNASSQILNTFK